MIGSIVEYLLAPDDPEAVVERMADPAIKIVSLTVTEGGYNFHAVTGEFQADDPGVVHDLEPGAAPKTTFGLVVEALDRRRQRGVPPFTVLSCDNIQGNGDAARRSFTAFARLKDPKLGEWVEQEVRFPNCMVDRITPVTTDDDRAALAERFGIEDEWPVVCEPFTQWVLEDKFGLGRPPVEDAGAQVVDDVEPYELMKLRLLNASHQGLCYLGYLAGYRLVHDVCQDPLFAEFLLAYMDREATPTLHAVPGIDLHAYKRRARRAVLQPAGARHRRAAVRGELRPDPQVAAAGDPAQPRARRRDRPGGAGRGGLGALRRGRRRAGRADQDRRPAGRHAERHRADAARRSARVRPQPGAVRRPGRRRAVRRDLPALPGVAAREGRPGDAGGPGEHSRSHRRARPSAETPRGAGAVVAEEECR